MQQKEKIKKQPNHKADMSTRMLYFSFHTSKVQFDERQNATKPYCINFKYHQNTSHNPLPYQFIHSH